MPPVPAASLRRVAAAPARRAACARHADAARIVLCRRGQLRRRHRAVPLVGTEFVPEADQGFISLRLNTPVGSSPEYTDAKVHESRQPGARFPKSTRYRRTSATTTAATRRATSARLTASSASARRRSSRRDPRALAAHPGHRAGLGQPADLGQPARARSHGARRAHQRIRRQGRASSRASPTSTTSESPPSRAAVRLQQRRRLRSRHTCSRSARSCAPRRSATRPPTGSRRTARTTR